MWRYDNKCLSVVFTYANPEQFLPVQRCDQVSKNYVSTNCSDVINYYNKSMDDIDLAYMLISFNRTTVKAKWWYLKLLFHCVDISKVNAWLLYHRHYNQLQRNKFSCQHLLVKLKNV